MEGVAVAKSNGYRWTVETTQLPLQRRSRMEGVAVAKSNGRGWTVKPRVLISVDVLSPTLVIGLPGRCLSLLKEGELKAEGEQKRGRPVVA